jgi:hypothetical protein
MIRISFHWFAFSDLDFTDVLRQIRRDIAENLGKRQIARITADNEGFVAQLEERPPGYSRARSSQ